MSFSPLGQGQVQLVEGRRRQGSHGRGCPEGIRGARREAQGDVWLLDDTSRREEKGMDGAHTRTLVIWFWAARSSEHTYVIDNAALRGLNTTI